MRKFSPIFIAFLVCTLTATTAFGLILPFGRHEIADSGTGCIGGYTSAHASCAYFRGNTAKLNEHLASLRSEERHLSSIKVILHAGAFQIDDPDETLLANAKELPAQIAVDWSVRKLCPTKDVLAGTCRCKRRDTVVDIWVANEIKLDDLRVPTEFSVESAAEIEQFVNRHANQQ